MSAKNVRKNCVNNFGSFYRYSAFLIAYVNISLYTGSVGVELSDYVLRIFKVRQLVLKA